MSEVEDEDGKILLSVESEVLLKEIIKSNIKVVGNYCGITAGLHSQK